MATEVIGVPATAEWNDGPARRRGYSRPAAWGVALALLALLSGDRTGLTAGAVQGIDPLDILNLQVKPNVVFVLDSSLRMGLTAEGTHYVGGDDPKSRFYMAKQALREVVSANQGVLNMGLIDMSAKQASLQLNDPFPGTHNGPFMYVSDDPNAAAWIGFFYDLGSSPADYDLSACPLGAFATPGCSEQVFRSLDTRQFNGVSSPYNGRTYVLSRLFYNNAHIQWNVTGGPDQAKNLRDVAVFDCASNPPASGLLGDDTDEFNDGSEFRPCFVLEDVSGSGLPRVVFYLTSLTYTSAGNPDGECDSSDERCVLEDVTACTAPSNAADIRSRLRLQDPFEASGIPGGLDDGVPSSVGATGAPDWRGKQPNSAGGAQLGPSDRPLDLALRAAQGHYASVVFPARPAAVTGLQKNFVIIVTSGRDTAGGDPVSRAAAMRGTSNPGLLSGSGNNDITTMVVTINGSPSFDASQVNALQSAGTNGAHTVAFGAATADELKASLNFAVSQTIATGTFSTESSITESVYEWSALAGPYSPFDPDTRYKGRVPTLLQSSFDMPGFVGHLKAFINATYDGKGPNTPKWDAGAELRARIWNGASGGAGLCSGNIGVGVDGLAGTPDDVANYNRCIYGSDGTAGTADDAAVDWTFAQLTGGPPSGSNVGQIPSFKPGSSAAGVIQRRIFTTRSHGVFPYNTGDFGEGFSLSAAQCPVPLWPPTTTSSSVGTCSYSAPVAPPDDTTAGLLDTELGIAGLGYAELQSRFGACLNAPSGHACLSSDPAVATARARREAREMILAFTAGAQVSTRAGLPRRNVSGDVLYVARFWPLAESTLAVPAVVPPPLEARPQSHTAEYLVFRDGLVTDPAGPTAGFGLRNPDKLTTTPTDDNGALEPLMSVVYHAANDMVHAFRAGPCHSSPTLGSSPTGVCAGGTVEKGGEELWGFVPYDQLVNLAERMQGQGRGQHTYVVASSLRFSDVFVPGTWTDSNSGRTFLGQWRTILVFGRGIAGQHYTALDITSPGPFTRASLDTQAPFGIWSRGNPDTQNGLAGGSANSLLDPTGDEGANDEAAYARMGETWSVPALAAVPPADFFDKEFALFMGSGYSPSGSTTVGKTFFALDALTGDVLHAVDVADSGKTCSSIQSGESCPVQNAIVANPAAYVAVQLAKGFVGNPSASTASLVYVGDLHGRMWKFITNSPGLGLTKIQPDSGAFSDSPDQPIGNAAALLNINNTPHVYWETGNDLRVQVPPNFRLIAMRDVGADANAERDADGLFRFDLENAFAGYRGTAQPATAFNAQGLGRAFFVGTKFTDQNVAGGNCRSRFDSVIFAVGAVSGDAVYNLDNSGGFDREIGLAGTKVNAIRAALGQVVLDQGDVGNKPPVPPPAPAAAPTANEGSSGEVRLVRLKAGSAVCRD